MLLWLLYALSVYTYQKIHLAKLDSSHSTVESLSYWVCITSRKIHLAKLGSSHIIAKLCSSQQLWLLWYLVVLTEQLRGNKGAITWQLRGNYGAITG